MRTLLRHALLLLLLSFISSNLYAATSVYEYQLNNGLKLIVKPDHRSPVVISSIWYKVGGSYEHNGITGVSHVVEHMMFRGTQKYGPTVLDQMVSRVGGQQNAMTGNDFTMYYQLLPKKQLALSFMLEADRMHNLLLTKKDFTKEIQVVMEERRMRTDDNPQSVTYERFLAAANINNPYHHQTIGWMTDLMNMTDQNVIDWYRTWYQPNNAIVVVVGDVKPEQVLKLAKKYFGKIPSKPVPKLKPRTEISSLGKSTIEVNIPAKLPLLIMGYQTPTLANAKFIWQPYALDVLSTILGGTQSSRLQNDLVRKLQILSSIGVSYDPFNLHSNQFVIFAIPTPGNSINKIESAIINQIKQLQTQPIDLDELKRVKAQMVAAKIYSRDSLQQQAMILGTPEVVGLSWKLGENYIDAINRVTPAQIQQVAKQFLITKRLTTAVLKPLTGASLANAKSQGVN